MASEPFESLLEEQIAYYQARAPEYDATSLEEQASLGSKEDRAWLAERDAAIRALGEFAPRGRVLELAAGTGQWTRHLVRWADSVTAVDASPEALQINRDRVGDARVAYVETDIFTWEADAGYDVVFFSFWLSHVPEGLFDPFWRRLGSFLKPEGRVFFIDERIPGGWRRALFPTEEVESGTALRRLGDGREFRIVKVFYEPDDLNRRLRGLGWDVEVNATGRWLYYGRGRRVAA
ncbi:MAG: class I SAM-dependent methyltransferase [Acidimicrobiia bacterium]